MGTAATVTGVMRLEELKARFQRLKEAYEKEYAKYTCTVAAFNQYIEAHGREKVRLYERIKAWIEHLFRLPYSFDRTVVDEHGVAFNARTELNKNLENSISVIKFITSAAAGLGTGATTLSVAYAAIAAFGVASTGTAISSLSGAAAANAIWAALGGGSLAAGGFGVAGGLLVGGLIVAAPALFIIGFSLHGEAEKLQTEIAQKEREMDQAVASYRIDIMAMEGIVATLRQREWDFHVLEQQIETDFKWLEQMVKAGMLENSLTPADKYRFDALIIRLQKLCELLQTTQN